MVKIDTIEECLEQVKNNGENLIYVHIQNSEICKAAVLANNDINILKYVDPKFRNSGLLKNVGIDDDFGSEKFEYIGPKNHDGSQSEFYAYMEIYGKCKSPELLPVIQNQLRRCLEDSKDIWEDVWTGNPMDAALFSMDIYPKDGIFKMSFQFADEHYELEDLSNTILEKFYDNNKFLISELSLFLNANYYQEYSNNCEYYIIKPVIDNDYDNIVEHEKWEFNTGDYDDYGQEANDARFSWIEKRRELWIAESIDNEKLLLKLKEKLETAEKHAVEIEKEHRS